MKIYICLFTIVLAGSLLQVSAQNTVSGRKIKSITESNIENKTKELDHITNFNEDGMKTEEIEYFSDGLVKTKTVYEYDSQKNCIKATRYGLKGKVDKVITYEYDANGNRIKESTFIPEKRFRTDKVFEYSYY